MPIVIIPSLFFIVNNYWSVLGDGNVSELDFSDEEIGEQFEHEELQ